MLRKYCWFFRGRPGQLGRAEHGLCSEVGWGRRDGGNMRPHEVGISWTLGFGLGGLQGSGPPALAAQWFSSSRCRALCPVGRQVL